MNAWSISIENGIIPQKIEYTPITRRVSCARDITAPKPYCQYLKPHKDIEEDKYKGYSDSKECIDFLNQLPQTGPTVFRTDSVFVQEIVL